MRRELQIGVVGVGLCIAVLTACVFMDLGLLAPALLFGGLSAILYCAVGHVRFLTSGTDFTTLKALSTRNGGETPKGDY